MNRSEAIAGGAKRYHGKVCHGHPSINGLRYLSTANCVECDRASSLAFQDARRRAQGKERRILYSPQEARERIRLRDLVRNAKRRKSPGYNDAQIKRKRAWRIAHRDRHLATNRAYDAKQLRENLQRRISKNLRHRIGKAMLGKTRGVSAVRDLGIGIDEFRKHIEKQFAPGMTWGNYGRWHLDHRRPLAAFDMSDNDQARTACHFTNYQPLWARDNHRKHAKLEWNETTKGVS